MKSLKKVLAVVLALCSLTAFLTVGAWADGIQIDIDKTTIYPGDTCNMTVSDTLGAGSYFDFILPYGVKITAYNGCTDGVHSYSLEIADDAVSADIEVIEKNDESIPNGVKTITITAPEPAKPSFNISTSANSYTIGGSPVSLSVVDKQNMDGYTVNWALQSSDGAAGGFSSNTGDNVSVSYISAGTSEIRAYIIYGSETIWSGNSVQISVVAAPTPTPTPSINLTPNPLSVVSGGEASITAALTDAPDGTVINWTKAGNITLSSATSTSGVPIKISAPAGIITAETATVTATIAGTSISKTCNVSITPNGVKSIEVTSDNYSPKVGESFTVSAKIKFSTPGDQVTAWKFDSTILNCTEMTGSYAKFKALKAGKSKVTAVSGTAETFIDITVSGGGAAINHQITYGNYSTFDGSNPLYFITNETVNNFKGVTVDGYALTSGNQYYCTSSSDGHILVALNPAYLKLLSSSNYHTIQIYSTINSPATGYFRNYGVTYNIYGVKTGDDNNIALWVTLCLIGFAGAAAIIITKRKEVFSR